MQTEDATLYNLGLEKKKKETSKDDCQSSFRFCSWHIVIWPKRSTRRKYVGPYARNWNYIHTYVHNPWEPVGTRRSSEKNSQTVSQSPLASQGAGTGSRYPELHVLWVRQDLGRVTDKDLD